MSLAAGDRLAFRLVAVIAACLVAVVLLESILQACAFALWLKHRNGNVVVADDPAAGNTVLCLGDSYTFGMGASSPRGSYPAQLEQKLKHALGSGWVVVNGGWPSRNSRELLEGLDALLAKHRPRVVCIVVGLNDHWSQPERLALPPLEGRPSAVLPKGFRWRWRTRRLFQILGTAFGGSQAEAGANPDDHLNQLRESLARGDRERARDQLEWLIEAHRDNPARWVAEALTEGLQAIGRENEALDFATGQLELYPESSRLWLTVARLSASAGDHGRARKAIDTALELAPVRKGARAFLWRTRAGIYGDTDHDIVADSLIRAWLDDGDEVQARQWFQVHRIRLDEISLRDRCRVLGLSDSDSSRVLAIYEDAVGEDNAELVLATLAAHVRQAVERIRAHGAEPLLGSYPWDGAFGSKTLAALAAELDVSWVPVFKRFESAREAEPGVELFVHDGHCNDAGYDLMAKAFAQEIVRLFGDGYPVASPSLAEVGREDLPERHRGGP